MKIDTIQQELTDLQKQSDIVLQRLNYHFLKADGINWIVPDNMKFMNEVLNEIKKLCVSVNSLALDKQRPLAKNKQCDNDFDCGAEKRGYRRCNSFCNDTDFGCNDF